MPGLAKYLREWVESAAHWAGDTSTPRYTTRWDELPVVR
ncbi:MAG: DUF4113 domain-containing protein [Betaproteobacteria bacterium]|nr:DUF4113 domain-containing protein [Betaproteobacteria bacterium]